MSDDGPALLRAILEAPADDAPRLVYADWLEENAGGIECPRCHGQGTVGVSFLYKKGDPLAVEHKVPHGCTDCGGTGRIPNGFAERAEFIRVQIELAKPDPCGLPAKCIHGPAQPPFGPGQSKPSCGKEECRVRERLRRRERHLLAGGREEWVLPGWAAVRPAWHETSGHLRSVGFVRGFGQSVGCRQAADWTADADALTSFHPIQQVALGGWPELDVRNGGSVFEFSLRGRDKIEFLTRDYLARATPEMLGTTPDGRLAGIIRRLLTLEWPQITFRLPDGSTC